MGKWEILVSFGCITCYTKWAVDQMGIDHKCQYTEDKIRGCRAHN